MVGGREPSEVVVVTGVGDMGVAGARRLAAGRHLVLADWSEENLHRRAEVFRDDGHFVHEVQFDVSDQFAVRALAERVGALGRLRVLFNTAGVSPVEATPEQIIAVDALGTAYLLDEFLPFVVDGTVGVFIASMAATTTTDLDSETLAEMALTPTAQLGQLSVFKRSIESGMAYGIAKRANQVRVQAASVTWGARGGRVVSVSPGIISSTNGRKELAGSSGEMMRQMIDLAAVGRIGTPEDIAAVVEFLVSQEACHITGIDILVDGGISAAMRYGAQAGESSRSST